MPLQIKTEYVSILPSRKGWATLTWRLKCWPEGDNPATDTPVINRTFSVQQKTQVEDKTPEQLLNMALVGLGEQMQAEIDKYKWVADKEALLDFSAKETVLAGGLNG